MLNYYEVLRAEEQFIYKKRYSQSPIYAIYPLMQVRNLLFRVFLGLNIFHMESAL